MLSFRTTVPDKICTTYMHVLLARSMGPHPTPKLQLRVIECVRDPLLPFDRVASYLLPIEPLGPTGTASLTGSLILSSRCQGTTRRNGVTVVITSDASFS